MSKQRGGFLMGMILGLLIGLTMALAVALYVTKVPVPFINKVPQRTADQDAAEAQRNKTWDPNAPLSNRGARPSATAASGQVTAAPASATPAGSEPETASKPSLNAASAPRFENSNPNPAAILSGQASSAPVETPAAKATGDGNAYFVQVGAYARSEDAEQQKARLGLLGFDTAVTEREQAGRKVYRVRVGPFNAKDQAESTKTSLEGVGIEAALVRIQK